MENIAYVQLDEKKVKLEIVQSRNGRYRILEQVENRYDLTEEITKDCLLSPKSKSDILKILNIYRFTFVTYGVTKMIATCSNIIVKARNYRGFLDEIYTNTGLNFVLTDEESVIKSIYVSCANNIDASRGYIVHIDTQSTYIMKFNRRNVLEYNSIPYGFTNLSNSGMSEDEMSAVLKKELKKCSLVKTYEDEVVIGTGESFIDIARIAKKLTRYPIDIDNNYEMSDTSVGKVVEFTKDLDPQKIKKIKGVGPNGAESLVGGMAIIRAIYDALNISTIVVSTANYLEGVVLSNLVGNADEKYSDLLQNSLDNYYEFKKEGLSINDKVYNMAVLLFKQMKVVHKLPRAYVKPLKIAAYMYNCGKFINFENSERHSLYAILNSNIAGASQKDILIAGFACACQNLDNFNLAELMKYKEILTDEDVDAIRKLGILVNMAVNLNASKKSIITDIVCDILGDSIIMRTVVSADPSFEILESMKVADDFKKVFKKSLRII